MDGANIDTFQKNDNIDYLAYPSILEHPTTLLHLPQYLMCFFVCFDAAISIHVKIRLESPLVNNTYLM